MKFAHFFIDRPVFAAVISIVMVIVGAIAAFTLPISQYPEIAPPTVVVSATYAGANARPSPDTVASPIEQQMNGVENMLYMSSQCTNDGSMRLTRSPSSSVPTSTIAQVQVQNRVAVAEPQLPDEVRRSGITVRRPRPRSPWSCSSILPTTATTRSTSATTPPSSFATRSPRLPGVGDVFLFGARDYSMRIWLDPTSSPRAISAPVTP